MCVCVRVRVRVCACVCVCVFVFSHCRRFAYFTEEGREMARGTYLRYPEEAQSVRNGGDVIFVFSLFFIGLFEEKSRK